MPVIETFVSADGLALQVELKQDDGTAFVLTGYTVKMTATYNGATKINAVTMTVTNAALGLAQYTPTAAEINLAGDYQGTVSLYLSGAMRRAETFTLRVNP